MLTTATLDNLSRMPTLDVLALLDDEDSPVAVFLRSLAGTPGDPDGVNFTVSAFSSAL